MTKINEILQTNPELLLMPDNKKSALVLLQKVMCSGEYRIAELLIKFGIDVNYGNPLEQVIRSAIVNRLDNGINYIELAELLLQNGASIEKPCLFTMVTYVLGIKKNYKSEKKKHKIEELLRRDMLLLLARHTSIFDKFQAEERQNLIDSLISKLVAEDESVDVELVEILVSALQDEEDFPLFNHAIENGNTQIVQFFINRGADLNLKDRRGNAPLHVAAKCTANLKMVKFLLSNGADINAKNSSCGKTPLHLAIKSHRDYQTISFFIENSDVHAQAFDGQTALHAACSRSDDKIIDQLIQKGADISAEDFERRTPFAILIITVEENYLKSMKVMVKEFAKLQYSNTPISGMDFTRIQENARARDYFEKCMNELGRMTSKKFFGPYTYYSALERSVDMKKLARRTKNAEFVREFEINAESIFSCYEEDLKKL